MRAWLDDQGAALMELLITIAVVALLVLGATGLTLMTVSADKKVSTASTLLNEQSTGATLFRQLIMSARPVKEGGRLVFYGTSNELTMVVRSPFQALPPGDYDAQLEISEDNDAVLTLTLVSRSDLGIHVQRPILSGVLAFSFWGQSMGELAPTWQPEWSHPLHGPDQVKLQLTNGARYASPLLLQAQRGAS